MVKRILLYLLLLIFITSCKDKEALTTNVILVGYQNLSDSYDTQSNIFERKYSDDTIKIKLVLTTDEKNIIIKAFNDNDFCKFPDEIDCKTWGVSPIVYNQLTLGNKNVMYIHSNSSWFCFNGNKFSKIQEIFENIVNNKEEVKRIPESDIFYE